MKGPGLLLCKPTPEPRASGKAMRRRDFIKAVESSAVACPLPARAQQADRVRRVGVLMNRAASDPQGQARVEAFKQGLQQLGWSEGRNVQIDVGWGEDDADLEQKSAAQLIAPPDIIFASGTLSVAALRRLRLGRAYIASGRAPEAADGFGKQQLREIEDNVREKHCETNGNEEDDVNWQRCIHRLAE